MQHSPVNRTSWVVLPNMNTVHPVLSRDLPPLTTFSVVTKPCHAVLVLREAACEIRAGALQAEEILVRRHGRGVRGAMFWTIDEEDAAGVHMAPALADVFRQTSIEDKIKDL